MAGSGIFQKPLSSRRNSCLISRLPWLEARRIIVSCSRSCWKGIKSCNRQQMYPLYDITTFTMSGVLDVLQMKEEDVLKLLAAGTHLGGMNLDFQKE
ncbi:hypothetical protein GH733_011358 [Mirounga leonina]|nr:hypothetical protein GH733_011358 [Mirounga leonina]